MSDREQPPPSRFGAGAWLATVVALVAGPVTAALYETGTVVLGPSGTLWPVAFVAGAGATGVVVGVVLSVRTSRVLGGLVVVSNLLVLALYGFFVLFFGLGGSR